METKPFQQSVLDTLDLYLDELSKQRAACFADSEYIRTHPETTLAPPDFPRTAWNVLKNNRKLPKDRIAFQYTSRTDPTGTPIPNICLKIPTGGGKTFLGAHAISRILGRYAESNRGIVLWIMPNEAFDYSAPRPASPPASSKPFRKAPSSARRRSPSPTSSTS